MPREPLGVARSGAGSAAMAPSLRPPTDCARRASSPEKRSVCSATVEACWPVSRPRGYARSGVGSVTQPDRHEARLGNLRQAQRCDPPSTDVYGVGAGRWVHRPSLTTRSGNRDLPVCRSLHRKHVLPGSGDGVFGRAGGVPCGRGEEPALLLVVVGIAVASGVPQRAFEVAPQASVHPGGMTAVGWASRSLAGEPPRRRAELMRTNGGLDADYRVPVWRDVPWGGRANI